MTLAFPVGPAPSADLSWAAASSLTVEQSGEKAESQPGLAWAHIRQSVRPGGSRGSWRRWYTLATALADAVGVILAMLIAALVDPGVGDRLMGHLHGVTGPMLVALVASVAWVACLASSGVWDRRVIGAGNDEYRRLLGGAARFTGLACLIGFASDAAAARPYLFIAIPLGTVISVVVHNLSRTGLGRVRQRGLAEDRVVLVGSEGALREMISHLRRAHPSGLRVVAALTGSSASLDWHNSEVRDLGSDRQALMEILTGGEADTVAVIDPDLLGPSGLRRLGWEIEGLGIDILVAPRVTEVAGPRLSVHPVAGLPLVHVEEARLSGIGRGIKEGIERTMAALLLLGLLPFLLVLGILIRLTSPGPAIFKQVRIGRYGKPFVIYKLRTMCQDAEDRLSDIIDLTDTDGLLFKMESDPRVTRVGRVLRRLSLDELPQLCNVVMGQMLIVGPRPPLPSEVERYSAPVGRRLLVKPGLTGLWQVSGRSDLPWTEGVLLDLHYVDNWSPSLDLVIMARTVKAMLQRRGAY